MGQCCCKSAVILSSCPVVIQLKEIKESKMKDTNTVEGLRFAVGQIEKSLQTIYKSLERANKKLLALDSGDEALKAYINKQNFLSKVEKLAKRDREAEEIRVEIRAHFERLGLNMSEVARRSGLHYKQVMKALNGYTKGPNKLRNVLNKISVL